MRDQTTFSRFDRTKVVIKLHETFYVATVAQSGGFIIPTNIWYRGQHLMISVTQIRNVLKIDLRCLSKLWCLPLVLWEDTLLNIFYINIFMLFRSACCYRSKAEALRQCERCSNKKWNRKIGGDVKSLISV